ncbi:cellulose biosynthesis cyclic di-GMP-binding regulatory protein BcsB [Tindallia californiensis]|uniref:Sporulation related domain-containing protein n=1 Tax=Tindallia californiensis TaxID=159292 RepID=A0A1H3R8C4_9FIRM|nr:cellulose biosynthesis cyclic di-GMP-binding regulatory protein BcsB [Tindallia californiensis]SDZ21488.1 Sporulation related domain-containing protein [Tindallia californiensis]
MKHMKKILAGWVILVMLATTLVTPTFAEGDNITVGDYVIQAGMFMTEPYADVFKARVEETGLTAHIIKETGYRVVVGPYQSEAEARQDLDRARSIDSNAYVYQLPERSRQILMSQMDGGEVANHQETAFIETEREEREIREKPSVKTVSLENDQILRGFSGSGSLNVSLRNKKPVEDGILHLYYHHSPLVDYPYSSVTVMLNGMPVESFFLREKEGMFYKKIPIKAAFLQEENQISLLTYHRLTDELCEDENNPALWLTLLKETYFEVAYEREGADQIFPYPFLSYEADPWLQATFVLDSFTEANIEAMYTMVYSLASYANVSEKEVDFQVVSLEDVGDLESLKNHFIYIGSPDFEGFLPERDKEDIKQGTLGLYQSVKENTTGLFILSWDESLRSKGSRIFLRDDFIGEFNGAILLDQEEIPEISVMNREDERMTLESLGYGNMLIEGREGQSEIFLQTPPGYGLDQKSSIVIRSRYHPAYHENGVITLSINNERIGSQRIIPNDQEQEYTFSIPSSLQGLSDFNLQIGFNSGAEDPCLTGSSQNIWAFVSQASYLKGPFDHKESFFLEDFPRPFASINQTHVDYMVFPEKPSKELLSEGIRLVSRMAGDRQRQLKPFQVLLGDYVEAGNRLIFLNGEAGIQGKYLEETLIQVDDTQSYIINEEEMTRFLRLDTTLAAAQLLYHEGNHSLFVVGTHEGALKRGIQELLEREDNKVAGDFFFMDQDFRIKSDYRLRSFQQRWMEEDVEAEAQDSQFLEKEGEIINLRALTLGTFVVLLLFILIVSIWKYRSY